MPRNSSPSVGCRPSHSTEPSTAGSSRSHQGELVGERRVPSERLLMWLLSRLDPKRFALPWEREKDQADDPQAEAQAAFPALLDNLVDVAEE